MTAARYQLNDPGQDVFWPFPPAFMTKVSGSDPVRRALAEAASQVRNVAKGECIQQQGFEASGLSVLRCGIAEAVHVLGNGRQQMVALFVPGDVLVHAPLSGPSRVSIVALTSGELIHIPGEKLDLLLTRFPGIGQMLWAETMHQALIQQEWIIRLGRKNAYERLAHFICELDWRFRAAGVAGDRDYIFPLTQSDLADALGLSVVHVNRVLQQLRKNGLLTLNHGHLTIIDRSAIHGTGGFDPQYLQCAATFK